MSGIFAQAVSRNPLRRDPFFPQDSRRCHRDGQDGRLGDLGELEFFFRTFKAKLRELVTQRRIGLVKCLLRRRIHRRQFFSHADVLRPLPGKNERDLVRHAQRPRGMAPAMASCPLPTVWRLSPCSLFSLMPLV